jgi:hypothetical protein
MRNFRQTNDFGISWGVPGLRIGKSQYGTWWISIGLPLGFRITKSLGSLKTQVFESSTPPTQPQALNPQTLSTLHSQTDHLTKNQKLLEKMKNQKN